MTEQDHYFARHALQEALTKSAADVARLTAERDELRAALECSHWLNRAHDIYRGAGVASPTCWSIDDQTRRTNALNGAAAILAKTAPVNPNAGVEQRFPRGRWTPKD